MTFTDTMGSMGTTNNAAKRPNMTGYVWKFTSAKNTLPALTDDGDYRISLVQRDGDQYIYTFDESNGSFTYNGKVAAAGTGQLDNTTAPTVGNTLAFDALLMTHIAVGQNWTVGKQSDFESVRTGGSGEW